MQDLRWNEVFAWYHFNYNEVFNYTQEDFERDAKAHADRGVTTIITFGGTHFMYTFEPYWEDIFACIGKIVRAFHKYGIKVVEHRSYALSSRCMLPDEEVRFYNYAEWPGMVERVHTDYTILGHKVSTLSQVDGRTGEPQICHYQAHSLCSNNPNMIKIAKYVAGRIMDLGVDGMMNDDIQFYRNVCACEHCRKKFKEETGYDLPDTEHWDAFYGDYDNPVYVAWNQFKVRSTTRFLETIIELERSKGLKMLRPCYISGILDSNWSSTSIENGLKYYMNYFQENFRPTVVRYGYPAFMLESIDRYARTQRVGIPSMSLFYPYTPPLTYFSWALSHTWGQMYTGTVHDADITQIERPYREFEKQHPDWLCDSRKCTDIAVFQSVLTRDCRPSGGARPMMSMMLSSCFSGLMTDMVLEEDSVEQLSKYPLIALNCASMLSDEHIARLRAYAEAGGRLLLIGMCGEYNDSAEKRTPDKIAAAFGINTPILSCGEQKKGTFSYHGTTVVFDDMRTTYCFAAQDGILKSGDTVLGITQKVGLGEVIWMLPQLDGAPLSYGPTIEYKDADKPHPIVNPSPIPKLRETTGAMLRAIVGQPQITWNCEGSDLLVSAFQVERGHVVHITNISETFATESKEAWHDDPLLGFDGGYVIPEEINVTLAYENDRVPTLTLYTPELENGLSLSAELSEGRVHFTVPKDTFGGYAMIAIEK